MTQQNRQDLTWVIAGPQGSGINSSAEVYTKIMARLGYYIFSNIEYHSNIKGKHSHYRVRTANYRIRSHTESIHVLAAFDEESLWGDFFQYYPTHWGLLHLLQSHGSLIYDSETITQIAERMDRDDIQLIGLPFTQLIDSALAQFGKVGEGKKYAIMKNTVALGATLGFLQINREVAETAIRESFQAKKKAADMNVAVADQAYDYVKTYYPNALQPLPQSPELNNQIVINATKAVGIAKIRAGCGFQSYYPISPATAESGYLESKQAEYPMYIVQSEDEVAAVNMAAAATHGGVRASTSTAGPGFALMAEGIGYAAITEAPGPVICFYQRAGPSTGIPTRQEQGDLRTSLHSAQGAHPHIVLAPGDVEESVYDTFAVFNLCDRYQLPAVILYDKHIARSMTNIEPFDDASLQVDHGPRYDPEQQPFYQRYDFSQSTVTPRSIPGEAGGVFWTSSDEHQQDGHITESVANRVAMMHKRMSKLEQILNEYPESQQVACYGNPDAETAIITWGSNQGVLLDLLETQDKPCDFLLVQVRLLNPFPTRALENAVSNAQQLLCYEQNWQAELAGLIQENLLRRVQPRILKYDGRPFSYDEAFLGLQEALTTTQTRIVLANGAVRDETTWGYQQVNHMVATRKQRPKQMKTAVPLPPGYNR